MGPTRAPGHLPTGGDLESDLGGLEVGVRGDGMGSYLVCGVALSPSTDFC